MKRIMIVGGPGSGKSTLAKLLGKKFNLPIFHMDMIHWKENWEPRSNAEKIPLIHEIHMKEEWVFEGGNSGTYGERLERADMLVWLDFPLPLRAVRIVRRAFLNLGESRPDLPSGCVERLDKEFLKFLHFTLTTSKRSRDKHLALIEQVEPSMVCRLKNLEEVRAFVERL
ncbi:MAG: DNA topology modulation protein FlaR [Rhizobiaceae bacterium]